MTSTKITDREKRAWLDGKGPFREISLGSGFGAKIWQKLNAKRDVDASLIWMWKQEKRSRNDRARSPMTSGNSRLLRMVEKLKDSLNLQNHGDHMMVGKHSWETISGDSEHFEPYKGLAWYALEIERRYINCRQQIWNGNIEWAAYKAFELGKLYQEYEIKQQAGDFIDKSFQTRQAQSEAGQKSNRKASKEAYQSAYFHYRDEGDKPTIAAENAAEDLGVSPRTIANAFGGHLP
mgnify:FL=1